ncbi:hypothetical protein Cni_G16911 [Canna indica]|uniref:Uncharacterized protein n=1 Tax=Canna indica TaxID=4628 RepID=A0AAQ3QEM0_9LILI|nr:hypothetical protein Cni_G16911 [Canna indica]
MKLKCLSWRYLLAEAGDTIYASFIGTKQYKDVIADANILQGTMFHEDNAENDLIDTKSYQSDKPLQTKQKRLKGSPKPAAHRVAVLSTLAILRVLATSSATKEHENLSVK